MFFGFLKSLFSDLRNLIFKKNDFINNKMESNYINTNNVLNINGNENLSLNQSNGNTVNFNKVTNVLADKKKAH